VASPNVRSRFAPLENSRFRLLFVATAASGIGNWLAVIALAIDMFDRTHSGWWVGELLFANILPAVFIGLLLGPLVDRLSRKRLMIASDVGRLAVFTALPFADTPGAIVVLAALAGIGNAFFRPAVLAGLPNMVDREELGAANALLQLVDWTSTTLGPFVGGLLVAASGPNLAYVVNAVTFGISAVLVALIPARLLQSDRPIGRGQWRDLTEGFSVVRHSRALMCVLVVWSIGMAASGIVNTAEVFLARESFHTGDLGYALLWTGSGVGLIIGGLSAVTLIERDVGAAYVRFIALMAVGIGCAAVAPNVWVGIAAMALFGFGNGGAVVANITLVQRGAADRVRGRAFTVLMSVNYAVLGLAFIAAGPLTNAYGARWAYGVACATTLVAAAAALRFTRGIEVDLSPATPPPHRA
jgi:MFS family permease